MNKNDKKNTNNKNKKSINQISKNKVIILLICSVFAIGILTYLLFNNVNISSISKKIIGEEDITKKSYGYPVISLLSFNSNKITVEAGYFRFGDVNLDGVVDEKDIEDINLILNSSIFFSQSQRNLADVDESGKIDEADIKLFEKYLKTNGKTEYDLNTNTLEYCVVTDNDSSNCIWQSNKIFELKEKKKYYFFAKQKNTGVISEVSVLDESVFDAREKM